MRTPEVNHHGTSSTTTRRRVWLGGALALIVLAVLAVVSLIGPTGGGPPAGPTAGEPTPAAQGRLAVPRRDPSDPLARGAVDAPVVIAEWGDFQCPFCRVYTENTEPALLNQYVASGQVRIEWHDFAYLGQESVLGARAARAAGRQDRFWNFHDALYRDQPRENAGEVTDRSLTATAARLGLDVPRFERDYADPALTDAVRADQQAGADLGIAGVPSFIIGDQLIFGAQPLPDFQQAIDAALARSR